MDPDPKHWSRLKLKVGAGQFLALLKVAAGQFLALLEKAGGAVLRSVPSLAAGLLFGSLAIYGAYSVSPQTIQL